jgi:hypothetical protein
VIVLVQVEIVIAARAFDDGRTEHPRHQEFGLRQFCRLFVASEFALSIARPAAIGKANLLLLAGTA